MTKLWLALSTVLSLTSVAALGQEYGRYEVPVMPQDAPVTMDLLDRSNYCQAVEEQIDDIAVRAMRHLIDRHMTFSGGHIPQFVYHDEERLIQTIAHIAYREIRYVRHDGANTAACDQIAARATTRIKAVSAKYP
jgi:hypothetical protein